MKSLEASVPHDALNPMPSGYQHTQQESPAETHITSQPAHKALREVM